MPKTIKNITKFLGLNTLRTSDEIGDFEAAATLNADLSSSSQVSPMKGYSQFANQANASDKITQQFPYERSSGFETLLQIRDNDTNSILEYLNPGDTRNSQDGEIIPLITNFTTGKVMSFAPYNDEGTDQLLMSNGADNFSKWLPGICILDGAVLAAAGTLTVKKITGDSKTNATDGFSSSGSLTVKDDAGATVTITYSGKTATTFTGCSGVTAMADTAGIAQTVDTSTHSGLDKFTFILTAQGRLWGTGTSGAETLVKYSEVGDFTNFTSSTNPDDPGFADFPEGGKNIAMGSIDNWIIVYKSKVVWGYALSFPTSTSKTSTRKLISDTGIAPSIKALALVGNDYVHVSPEGQIRRLSRLEAQNLFQTEDLALQIRPTIKDFVWDDAAITYWKKENILLIAGKSDSDQSNNDKVVSFQFSQNEKGSAILNRGIMDWFVNAMTVYDQQLYFGSSGDSKLFKAFDGFTKNGAAYKFIYTTKLEHFGSPFTRKNIEGLWVKGRISAGSELKTEILFGENGAIALYEKTLAQSDSAYVTEVRIWVASK